MCGIYGYVGIKAAHRLALANALAYFNEERGFDSAGVALSHEDLSVRIVKRAGTPVEFIKRREYIQAVQREHRVLIGHCRWATMGAVSDRNAHPFRKGNTVGVHNGHCFNTEAMKRFCGKTYAVDSQYLIDSLETTGTLGPAQGALNVAYFKRKDSADLRLIKRGNPLSYALTKDETGFVFSSEEKHLVAALQIAGIEHKTPCMMIGNSTMAVFMRDKIAIEHGDLFYEETARPAHKLPACKPAQGYVPFTKGNTKGNPFDDEVYESDWRNWDFDGSKYGSR